MKKIRVFFHKENTRLKPFPYQKSIFDSYIASLPDGATVSMVLSEQKSQKTNAQLAYYYSVILSEAVRGFIELGHDTLYTASAFGGTDERKTTADTMDSFLKSQYQNYKGLNEKPLKRNMSVDECSEFIEFVLKWLAEKPGIYCPPPRG